MAKESGNSKSKLYNSKRNSKWKMITANYNLNHQGYRYQLETSPAGRVNVWCGDLVVMER